MVSLFVLCVRAQAFLKARLSPDDVPPASPDPMHDISEEKPSPAASSAEEDFHCE